MAPHFSFFDHIGTPTGILDETQFDSGSYGGTPPGWLGALLQLQSGPGFAPDPAQLPPNVAPMSGVATFPRAAADMAKGPGAIASQIGADGRGKDAGASNPFADFLASLGSGNAFLPGPAAAPSAQAAPSLLDRLSAGATNFATSGSPIAGVVNSVRGLATGERTDAAGIRRANQTATFNALVDAGVAPQFAQVAALNPEILKTIVAAHFRTNPSLQNIDTPSVAPSAAGSPAPQPSAAGRADPEAEAPVRPLDSRLANLRRLLLSGSAALPLVTSRAGTHR